MDRQFANILKILDEVEDLVSSSFDLGLRLRIPPYAKRGHVLDVPCEAEPPPNPVGSCEGEFNGYVVD